MSVNERIDLATIVDVYKFWEDNGRFARNTEFNEDVAGWYKGNSADDFEYFLFSLEAGMERSSVWVWLSSLEYRPFLNHPEKQDGWYKWNNGLKRWDYKFSFDDGYALWKDRDKEVSF